MGLTGDGCIVQVFGPTRDDLERALKRFTKTVRSSGLLAELRRRQFFASKSVARRKKAARARARRRRDARRALELRPDLDWKPRSTE